MNTYEKNLQTLHQRNPDLAESIANLQIDSNRYHYFESQQGSPALQILGSNGSKYLWHSRYDPIREANREMQNLDHSRMYVPLFAGIGLGYTLRCLWDNYSHEFTSALLLERDPAIFTLALKTTPLDDILAENRVSLHVGDDLTNWPQKIREMIPSITSCKLQIIQHSPSFQYYSEFYQTALNQVNLCLHTTKAEFDLMIRSGVLIQQNMWQNLPAIVNSIALFDIKNLLKNHPAIVAAAGPSLDKNVHQLREVQDHFLLISVDTALRTLIKHDIEPHIVVATDPSELNWKHFEKIYPYPDTILAFDAECYHEIPYEWPHRKLYINLDKTEFTRWIEQQFGPYGIQPKGGSVGHTAFYLARDLGANPIIFIGLDLAFDAEGGKTHTANSALFREHEKIQRGVTQAKLGPRFQSNPLRETIVWVPGSVQEQVPTSQVMWIYIQQFVEQFAQSKARIIDATEGGARLQGAEISTLQKAIEQYLDTSIHIQDKLNELKPKPISHEHVTSELNRILNKLEEGEKAASLGLQFAKNLLSQISQGQELKETPEWRQMAEQFNYLYNSKEIKIALEQAMFSAVFQFVQKEWPHEAQLRLQKYKTYFEESLGLHLLYRELIQQVRESV